MKISVPQTKYSLCIVETKNRVKYLKLRYVLNAILHKGTSKVLALLAINTIYSLTFHHIVGTYADSCSSDHVTSISLANQQNQIKTSRNRGPPCKVLTHNVRLKVHFALTYL